jgi:hypothetical protein
MLFFGLALAQFSKDSFSAALGTDPYLISTFCANRFDPG